MSGSSNWPSFLTPKEEYFTTFIFSNIVHTRSFSEKLSSTQAHVNTSHVYVGMAVYLQQIFLFLFQVGEDNCEFHNTCLCLSALNAVTWSNESPNLSSDCSMRAAMPAADSSAFCWWPQILNWNTEQRGETFSCCLYLMHLPEYWMGGVHLLLRPWEHHPLPLE